VFDVPVTLRASGRATVDTAWERYVDFSLWPTWSPQITGVETDAARIAPGVTGRVRGPLGVRVDFEVEAVDELARTWSWTARFGLVRLWLWHEVTARDHGCATALRVRGPAPVVVGYAPLARFALGRLVRP
jgi:hypothetical protein